MQDIISYILNELLSYMKVKIIKFTDYTTVKTLKETPRQRYVLIHIVQQIEDIE